MLTTAVGVVVPAHDEQELLPACLASLQAAAAQPGVPPVRVVVVADRCSDDTADLARSLGAEVLEVDLRNAGAARRHGLDAIVGKARGPLPALWLATTDADSVVPPEWFADQLRWRTQGYDAVAGTVDVTDWADHDAVVRTRFATQYAWDGPQHPHVHGANLSLTAAAYAAVGGLPPLVLAEDHALVAALEAHGFRVARPTARPVLTSARSNPRCEGGFGTLLTTLACG